jgi:hypothetical protein
MGANNIKFSSYNKVDSVPKTNFILVNNINPTEYIEIRATNYGDGSLSFAYAGYNSLGESVTDLNIDEGNGEIEIKVYHKTITFGA